MHLCCSVDIAFFRSCVYSLMLSIAFWPPYGNYYEPCDDKLIKLVPRAATNGNFPPDFVLSHSGYSESVCPYLLNIILQISLEQNTCRF